MFCTFHRLRLFTSLSNDYVIERSLDMEREDMAPAMSFSVSPWTALQFSQSHLSHIWNGIHALPIVQSYLKVQIR